MPVLGQKPVWGLLAALPLYPPPTVIGQNREQRRDTPNTVRHVAPQRNVGQGQISAVQGHGQSDGMCSLCTPCRWSLLRKSLRRITLVVNFRV